jgi:uncharacterized protein
MNVFVDTSALYAVLDADDADHQVVVERWAKLIGDQSVLVTSSYVLVETISLVQHRLGMQAVRAFYENMLPMLRIQWVDERSHHAAMTALLTAARRQLSLVDCVSFELMRQLQIRTALTLDRHFREQGFESLPGWSGASRP